MPKYVEVFVAAQAYQKTEPLTYTSEADLPVGSIVRVPFGRGSTVGFVSSFTTTKPRFKTKPIGEVLAPQPLPAPTRALFAWLQAYYPSGSGPALQLFIPSNLLTPKEPKKPKTAQPPSAKKRVENATVTPHIPAVFLPESESLTTSPDSPRTPAPHSSLPDLTDEQTHVITAMDMAPKKHFVLHGDTGSGKTRVYIERAKRCVQSGRSAVILTPEIALTPQLTQTFKQTFGDTVIVMHSGLTAKTRREHWLRALTAREPLVIVGARSALFAPLSNIGLIVVDEMHEPAYKQEQAPRYNALRVAGALGGIHKAEVIYGSATPPIAEYYIAQATKTPILRMRRAARSSAKPVETAVVDLKDRDAFSKNRHISNLLLERITRSLTRGEQALVYLNRRGTAKLILCQNCGWQALCPNCDLPFTYHGDSHRLQCHTCGLVEAVPYNCPQCGSAELLFRSIGTKALVSALEVAFPQARIQRFDTDVSKSEAFQQHYDAVHSGEVDILVGTQILAKGLDLPRLSTVGVISADTSFYLPDFTAAERSYQLLYQVLGRVGRGHTDGHVVVQTFTPDSPILTAAVRRDWDSFYASQIAERKQFLFPPFCYVLKLMASRAKPENAQDAITKLHTALRRTAGLKIQLSEPMPRFYEHTHGQYHWQLIVKATVRGELIKALQALPSGDWTYDLDPANLL